MLRTLHSRILFYFILISIIGTLLVSYAFRLAFDDCFADYLDDKREDEIQRVIGQLKSQYEETGDIGPERLSTILPYQAMTESLFYQIYDENDREIVDSTSLVKDIAKMREEEGDPDFSNLDITSETRLIEMEGKPIAKMEILYHRGYEKGEFQFKARVNSYIIGSAVGMIIIAVILSMFLSRKVTSGLRQVRDATRELTGNNLSVRVPLRGLSTELAEVGLAVNSLAQSLDEQQKLRKQFTDDLSHELRTPLTTLRTNLEAFQDGVFEPTKERLSKSYGELMRLVRMVDDLDDLMAAENPEIKLNKTTLDAGKLTHFLKDHYTVQAAKKEIRFTADVPEKPIEFQADRDRFMQIMGNLISNAIKYTPEGGTIHLGVLDKGDMVGFSVADTGPGISEDHLQHIFERFYRADKSRARKTGGTGIGLSIAKALAETHGGRMEAVSQEGEGSVFTVYLPK